MRSDSAQSIFRVNLPSNAPLPTRMLSLMESAITRLLALHKLDDVYSRSRTQGDTGDFLARALDSLGVVYRLDPDDRERIPAKGPALVVANHPFGGLEGLILAHILLAVRPDVKIMANYILHRIPELRDLFIFVDPFEGPEAASKNLRPLREAMGWLDRGGLLAVFPAGEVAHLELGRGGVVEPPWNPAVSRLAARSGAPVSPVHFGGNNGPLFHMAGLVHPRLRTALLPRELLKSARKPIQIKVGGPIAPDRLENLGGPEEVTGYLRWRTRLLDAARGGKRSGKLLPFRRRRLRDPAPLAPAQDPEVLRAEVAALGPERLLAGSGDFLVFHARREEIPNLMLEIGRAREETFRGVGEGTGQSLDLDSHDDYYEQLCLWNQAEGELAGAYRLGRTDLILPKYGREGLYTASLFKFKPGFFESLGPALELGRSFIKAKYQRSYSALLLLWKGIGGFMMRDMRYRHIFGPVSVSNDYHPLSRRLMVEYLGLFHASPLAGLVKPRHPARLVPEKSRRHRQFLENLSGLDELSEIITDIEGRGRGVPILVRQYIKLAAKAVSWNVDPDFGQALDCLMVSDMLEADPKTLNHYCGKDKVGQWLARHGGEDGERKRAAVS